MQIELDLKKSIQENANQFFEKNKKSKKKAIGARKAIESTKKKIKDFREKAKTIEKKEVKKKRKAEWYEKFHWFYSSDNNLVLGGRDAQSNEQLLKKYMDKTDLYFHAEIFGAPHCIVKSETGKITKQTKEEAAKFAGVFSKAWQQKLAAVDVYAAMPEQVSKKAPTKEALGTGAFMIYGKREWFRKTKIEIALGLDSKERVVSGPVHAVKKNSKTVIEVVLGTKKKWQIAKEIKKLFESKAGKQVELDEIIKMLPTGEMELKKQ